MLSRSSLLKCHSSSLSQSNKAEPLCHYARKLIRWIISSSLCAFLQQDGQFCERMRVYIRFSFSLYTSDISFLPGLLCDRAHNDVTRFHTSYSFSLFCTSFSSTKVGFYCSGFNCSAKSRLQGCRVASLIDLHISRGKAISLIKERSWTKDDPWVCGNS